MCVHYFIITANAYISRGCSRVSEYLDILGECL